MNASDLRQRLRVVMETYNVDIPTVAKLINKTTATIRQYRSVSGCNISRNDLELLELKLKAKHGQE